MEKFKTSCEIFRRQAKNIFNFIADYVNIATNNKK